LGLVEVKQRTREDDGAIELQFGTFNARHHGKSDLSRLEDFGTRVPSNSNTACEYPDDPFPKAWGMSRPWQSCERVHAFSMAKQSRAGRYVSGRSPYWIKSKNPRAPAVSGKLKRIGADGPKGTDVRVRKTGAHSLTWLP
jgi:hypothetical protein